MENSVVEMVVNLVSNVGFPILMCYLLFKQSDGTYKTVLEHINKQNKSMQESLDRNTEAVDKLRDRIDKIA